jgi:hypothetical protein
VIQHRCRCGKKMITVGERFSHNDYQHASPKYNGPAAYCGPMSHVQRDELLAEKAELRTENECLSASCKAAAEQYDALLEGREALKAQTVRIRRAALGDAKAPGTDTEEIVRALRLRVEELEERPLACCCVALLERAEAAERRVEEAENALKTIWETCYPLTNTADSTTTGMVRKLAVQLTEAQEQARRLRETLEAIDISEKCPWCFASLESQPYPYEGLTHRAGCLRQAALQPKDTP